MRGPASPQKRWSSRSVNRKGSPAVTAFATYKPSPPQSMPRPKSASQLPSVGTPDRQPLLQRQRIAADPAAREDAQVHASRRAHSRVAAEIDEQAAEDVRAIGRDRAAHGRRDSRLRGHVLRTGVLEAGAQEPTPGRGEAVVAGGEGDGAGEGRGMPVIDRRGGAARARGPRRPPAIALA